MSLDALLANAASWLPMSWWEIGATVFGLWSVIAYTRESAWAWPAGLINVLEVLDGERNLVSAQQNTVQLRRAQLESAAQLYKALGGGA